MKLEVVVEDLNRAAMSSAELNQVELAVVDAAGRASKFKTQPRRNHSQ